MRISDWSSDVCSSDLLIGREQREAPPPGNNAGEVARHVVMRRDMGGVADPDARHGIGGRQAKRVGIGPARQMIGRGGRTGIERGRGLSGFGKRAEEHTSELQSLMRNSYAVICL